MTTTLTPPPAPPRPPVPNPATPGPGPAAGGSGSAGRIVAILLIVLGSLVVIGLVLAAVRSTLVSAAVHTSTRTVGAQQIEDLDVDLAAGSLTITFVEGLTDAELEVTGPSGADHWTLAEDDGTLTVASPDRRWVPWMWFQGTGDAELRLPASDRPMDADLEVTAGDLRASGDFDELDITLGAGRVRVDGSAGDLEATLSAGDVDLDLVDVETASFGINAGSADLRLTGDQPRAIDAEVNAGRIRMIVPEGDYDVRSDVSAGEFDNRIGSRPGADSTITVRVSAGQAQLATGLPGRS